MITLHHKDVIETFLRRNVYLHIYSLGDLDDFFWPYTVWYASRQNGAIRAIILFYVGQPLPVLLALGDEVKPLTALLGSISHLLPQRFYAHLSPGLETVLAGQYRLKSHGEHYKMALQHPARLDSVDSARVIRLSPADLDDILALYQTGYPGNWFDRRMLETNQYFGLKAERQLVSIAGVHVYSERYRVAALGNITTHPAHRGRGYGRAVTAKLGRSLSKTIDHIGLNVRTDNQIAVSLYKKLGFEIVAAYGEYMVETK